MADIDTIESRSGGKIDYTVGSALDIFGGYLPYSKLVSRNNKNK
jgi:phosphoribosylformimino-5-aminoimidazole carboxamide ribotide isomerase